MNETDRHLLGLPDSKYIVRYVGGFKFIESRKQLEDFLETLQKDGIGKVHIYQEIGQITWNQWV